MNPHDLTENSYVLLTPGPLTTTKSVKAAMLRDWCTWDDDYNSIVQDVRRRLVELATPQKGYTSVLMQGSGTFSVEAVLGTAVPAEGKILILANGAYGERMAQIANRLRIPSLVLRCPETERHDPEQVRTALRDDRSITHVALAHCETTTGILNDLDGMAAVVRDADRCLIVDAMSSFGGIPMDAAVLGIDFLISSSNKCLQGVPGFGLVVARTSSLEPCAGRARSLSLDVFDQWQTMEGVLVRMTINKEKLRKIQLIPVVIDDEGPLYGVPRFVGDKRAQETFERLQKLSAPFKTQIVSRGWYAEVEFQ